jgi:hypothetical protein
VGFPNQKSQPSAALASDPRCAGSKVMNKNKGDVPKTDGSESGSDWNLSMLLPVGNGGVVDL